MSIPLLDIEGFDDVGDQRRPEIVRQWQHALDTIGFVTIKGHGIPRELATSLDLAARGFFEQSLESKLRCMVSDPGQRGSFGYIPPDGESVGRTSGGSGAPDLVESLSFSDIAKDAGRNGAAISIYQALPPQLLSLVMDYADAAYQLGRSLMRLSALALDLPESYFDDLYSPMQHKLRLAYYPRQTVAPVPGQLRNAAHTDFAGFTILLQDTSASGLQALTRDESWIDVPPVEGALVINTGDLLQRWTNDRWVSNVHRVINPVREPERQSGRLSVVFFTGPREDAEISCLPSCSSPSSPARYATTTAGDHVRFKLQQTYGKT